MGNDVVQLPRNSHPLLLEHELPAVQSLLGDDVPTHPGTGNIIPNGTTAPARSKPGRAVATAPASAAASAASPVCRLRSPAIRNSA
ncbi:hypothetical protein [Kribbella qitaiheensis]|uniref:hypothetical protein n=1 Tax=Kribbella qitaiheensis TaxID=1544730 RepID=UPI00162703A3|nr:hypothetical protein [Kribbella qitaiheensis]